MKHEHYYLVQATYYAELRALGTRYFSDCSIYPLALETNVITRKVFEQIEQRVHDYLTEDNPEGVYDLSIKSLSYLGCMTKEQWEGAQ